MSLPIESDWRQRKAVVVPDCIAPLHDLLLVRGCGAVVEDAHGRRYIDLTGGLGVLILGYGHPRVTAAIERQARALVHTSFPTLPAAPYIELAERLCSLVDDGNLRYKAAFFNSGAEAVENAAKICRWATGRPAFLNLESGFHGRTWASVALTYDQTPYKANLGDLGIEVHSIPLDIARGPRIVRQAASDLVTDQEVDTYLKALGAFAAKTFDPNRIAGFFLEPVLGNSGVIPIAPAFLEAAARFCRQHRILLVTDEIQSGLGRTGAWLAAKAYGVQADLVLVGKALGGGLPLAAVVGRADVLDALPRGALGSTQGGNPVACAAGCAVIDAIADENLLPRAGAIAGQCQLDLGALDALPASVELRVIGSMAALEFPPADDGRPEGAAIADAVLAHARANGLLLLRGGRRRAFVRMLPPLTIDDEELEPALRTLAASVSESIASLSARGA